MSNLTTMQKLVLLFLAYQFLGGGGIGGVTPGPKQLAIVFEDEDETFEVKQLINDLRTGSQAEVLKAKGHTLTVYDDDDVGADLQPVPLLVQHGVHGSDPTNGQLQGTLLILSGDNLIKKLPLPGTADLVIQAIGG